MIKKFLILLFGICGLISTALHAQQKADGIIWSSNKLTWDDFQEDNSVEKNSGVLARTHTKLYVTDVDTTGYQLKGGVSLKVYALMIPSFSWVRKSTIGKNSVLAHEQLHFDIVELMARRLRKELAQLTVCCDNYQKDINKLKREYFMKLKNMQAKYDATHKAKWQQWVDDISYGLAELNGFASPQVFIPLQNK